MKLHICINMYFEYYRSAKSRRPSADEKTEDSRIRERLRNLPVWKKTPRSETEGPNGSCDLFSIGLVVVNTNTS